MKRLILLVVFLIAGRVYPWVKNYEKVWSIYSVQQAADGGYVATGRGWGEGELEWNELFLLKTDSLGNEMWSKLYGGSGYDKGRCVRQTADGGYIITGAVNGPSEWEEGDLWLLKTDGNGDTMWTKTYGDWWDDAGYWVEVTKDGGYIITGTSRVTGDNLKFWILKTDEYGDTLWTRLYDFCSHGYCVRETEGGYIFATQWGLVKADSLGDTVWTYLKIGGKSVCEASDGGYVLTSTNFGEAGARDIFLIKTDADGDSVWGYSWGGTDEDYSYCIQQTTDSGYIISGATRSFGEARVNVWLLKTDANGDTTWTRTLGGGWGRSVQQTTDGGYILSGGATLIKTDSLGYAGIEEPPVQVESNWQVISPIGPQITLRYSDRPQGFHASIFDATGRKVDEVHSTEQSGTITWGKGMSPGVYFVREESKNLTTIQKVILIH